jgi:glycerophosphoryl diester phosphodiesterase
MRSRSMMSAAALAALLSIPTGAAFAEAPENIQLGPRPFYLVDQMTEGKLKDELKACSEGPFFKTDFSIGHRGAPLQFPEHTKESYEAAARMGAGIIECDVTFTADGELVCRHAQCDLHTTTNILATELAAKCSEPFSPAEYDVDGNLVKPASARCCASDITLAEFKSLKGKMDAADRGARTVEEYLGGTADWRTDSYATGATLLTHAESIELIRALGAKFTPELKGGNAEDIARVFGSQEEYARKLVLEYKRAGVPAEDVWLQSFNIDDVLFWFNNHRRFGKQAVYLDGSDPAVTAVNPPVKLLRDLKAAGVNIIAPPLPALLTVKDGQIKRSPYAYWLRRLRFDVITWTLERSGRIVEDVLPTKGTGSPSFYFSTTLDALENDGDIMTTLDVLAQEVGIIGIFSDWPATVTYYANCKGL